MVQKKQTFLSDRDMIATKCALCGSKGNFKILYPAHFTLESLSSDVFSARHLRDGIHYQIVKCKTCGLIRSNPIIKPNRIEKFYRQSKLIYESEIENLKSTYGYYIEMLSKYGLKKQSFLEIGCGNGFILEEALEIGFTDVWGIEPSRDAVEKAKPEIKNRIICDVLKPRLFKYQRFDLIALFQILEHIIEPNKFLSECYRLLKRGGLILCLSHNTESFSVKLLGKRSPVIDIGHIYFYDKSNLIKLFIQNNFGIIKVTAARNIYSLHYWINLIPFDNILKRILLQILKNTHLAYLRFALFAGNFILIAGKD